MAMPPALRRYWAKKRRKKSKRRYTTGGKKTMAKRYYRKKSGRRSGRVSVMGVITAAALGISVVAKGEKGMFTYAGSPVGYLQEKNPAKAINAVGRNLTDAGTYVPVIIPIAIWAGGRMFLGNKPLGRKWSLF